MWEAGSGSEMTWTYIRTEAMQNDSRAAKLFSDSPARSAARVTSASHLFPRLILFTRKI